MGMNARRGTHFLAIPHTTDNTTDIDLGRVVNGQTNYPRELHIKTAGTYDVAYLDGTTASLVLAAEYTLPVTVKTVEASTAASQTFHAHY